MAPRTDWTVLHHALFNGFIEVAEKPFVFVGKGRAERGSVLIGPSWLSRQSSCPALCSSRLRGAGLVSPSPGPVSRPVGSPAPVSGPVLATPWCIPSSSPGPIPNPCSSVASPCGPGSPGCTVFTSSSGSGGPARWRPRRARCAAASDRCRSVWEGLIWPRGWNRHVSGGVRWRSFDGGRVRLLRRRLRHWRHLAASSPRPARALCRAQIDPGAGSHGIQGTGGAVELVERSEGGLGVPCSTTVFVLSFRGVASSGPAAGFFSYGRGAVE